MEHSPWEANWFSRNSPHFIEPEGSLLCLQVPATFPYTEPDQSSACPPSHFLKIHLNITFLSKPESSEWSLSFSFPTKTLYAPPLSPVRATCPAHLILLDLITWIIFSKKYRSLSSPLCSFLHSPIISSLLGPNILLSTLISNTLSLQSSLSVSDHVSHPYKTTRQNYSSVHLNFYILDSHWQTKDSALNVSSIPWRQPVLNFF